MSEAKVSIGSNVRAQLWHPERGYWIAKPTLNLAAGIGSVGW